MPYLRITYESVAYHITPYSMSFSPFPSTMHITISHCSAVQQELYDGFLRGRCHMTDDMLEQQLIDIKQQGGTSTATSRLPRQQQQQQNANSLSSTTAIAAATAVSSFSNNNNSSHEPTSSPLHPLKALMFLKLVGLHPALVVTSPTPPHQT